MVCVSFCQSGLGYLSVRSFNQHSTCSAALGTLIHRVKLWKWLDFVTSHQSIYNTVHPEVKTCS